MVNLTHKLGKLNDYISSSVHLAILINNYQEFPVWIWKCIQYINIHWSSFVMHHQFHVAIVHEWKNKRKMPIKTCHNIIYLNFIGCFIFTFISIWFLFCLTIACMNILCLCVENLHFLIQFVSYVYVSWFFHMRLYGKERPNM